MAIVVEMYLMIVTKKNYFYINLINNCITSFIDNKYLYATTKSTIYRQYNALITRVPKEETTTL